MSNVASIALSGMSAATRRLEVSARNVANALSAGPSPSADPAIAQNYPAAYAPKRVDQVETAGGGTRAIVTPLSPATVLAYDPAAPYADADGLVAMPNVDFAGEAIEQLIARYSFAFNAVVLRSYARMMHSLIDITA
jgi:flagellar basal-body rod protein FlgC